MINRIRKFLGEAFWPSTGRTTDPEFRAIGETDEFLPTGNRNSQLINACVNMILGQLIPCPRRIYRNDAEQRDHPLTMILQKPYSKMDGFHGWEIPFRDLLKNGNGHMIVRRRNGIVVDMIPAIRGGSRWGENGDVFHSLMPLSGQGFLGPTYYADYPANEVVSLNWYGFNGLDSPSPIRYAISTALYGGIQNYLTKRVQKGRNVGGTVFEYKGAGGEIVTESQVAEAIKTMQNEEYGFHALMEKGRTPLLPQGINPGFIEAISDTDLKLLDILKWSLEDIARAYGIAPARLGQLSGGGAGVRTQQFIDQMSDLERSAVQPVASIVDAALTSSLFTENQIAEGWMIKTDTSMVGMGSARDRATLADLLVVRAAIMTVNEVRMRYYGLPPIAGGDELRQPKGAPAQEKGDGETE